MIPSTIKPFTKFIEDNSGVISQGFFEEYNEKFASIERSTTMQVVTLLFPHRQGNSLFDIGLEVFNQNKIGQAGKNNGLLLLISTDEKKIRIVVGKGLEWTYTNEICRDIIENDLRPLLNEGKYEELIRKWYEIVSEEKEKISLIKDRKYQQRLSQEKYIEITNPFTLILIGTLFLPFIVFFASFGVVMIHLFTFFLLTLLANVCLNFRKKVVVITTSLLDTIRAFLLALIPSLAFAFDYFAKWYLLAGFFLLCTFIIPFKKNIKLNFIRILFLLCGLFSLNAGIELQRCETSTSNVCVIQNALNKMTQDGSQYSSSNSSSSSSSWSSSSSDWSSSSSSSFGGGGGSSGGGGWGD